MEKNDSQNNNQNNDEMLKLEMWLVYYHKLFVLNNNTFITALYFIDHTYES